jgi:hypothetical protein
MSAWRSENVRTGSGFRARYLVDVRRREGAHAWLLAASLRRAHNITGDADDTVLHAEQVQRLDGFFGEADNSARREHSIIATINVAYGHSIAPSLRAPS